MPGPRDPRLSEANRAQFRAFGVTPEMWQQMAQYGMGQSNVFPSYLSLQHSPDDADFLSMMMKAFKDQEDKRRAERAKTMSSKDVSGDEYLKEAKKLSGQ
jgi:hypothetical protein